MAWPTDATGSKIFSQYLRDTLNGDLALDADGAGALKAALYNNTTTPDQNATRANIAYNVGQWVTANEVSQAGQWAPGGIALANASMSRPGSANIVMLDADDTASGAAATLTGVVGALVYADLITGAGLADPGVCFNGFGGAQSVTNGTFTIVWHGNGLFRLTI